MVVDGEVKVSLVDAELGDGTDYKQYVALGGLINELDYQKALEMVRGRDQVGGVVADEHEEQMFVRQVERIMRVVQSDFKTPEMRARCVNLFVALRNDIEPGNECYHGVMGDENIFMQVLKMMNLPGLIRRMRDAYPYMRFV